MGGIVSSEENDSVVAFQNERDAFQQLCENLEMPCLRHMKDQNCTNALSLEDIDHLPVDILEKGKIGLEKLKMFIKELFPQQGKDISIESLESIQELLSLLGLESLKQKIVIYLSKRDLSTYIDECIEGIGKNPIFIVFAAEYESLPDDKKLFLPDSEELPIIQEEFRRAVLYSAILDAMSKAFLYENPETTPNFATELEELLLKKEETMEWKEYFNTFERMKVATVKMPMRTMVQRKTGDLKPLDNDATPVKSSLTLHVNILEAMYQDVLKGNIINADVAFELLAVNSDGDTAVLEEKIDQEWVLDDKPTGICLKTMPFNRVWNNLYSTWNTAFVLQYLDSPYFLAKLLNPAVCGLYHEVDSGIYLTSRVVTLFVHIFFVMFSRANAKKRVFAKFKWRTDIIRALLSRVNAEAAGAYQKRVEDTLEKHGGTYKNSKYDVARVTKYGLWGAVKGMTIAFVEVNEAAGDIGDFFKSVKGLFGFR